jgi:hypothetical protein
MQSQTQTMVTAVPLFASFTWAGLDQNQVEDCKVDFQTARYNQISEKAIRDIIQDIVIT